MIFFKHAEQTINVRPSKKCPIILSSPQSYKSYSTYKTYKTYPTYWAYWAYWAYSP
jgi:hypothetical protein